MLKEKILTQSVRMICASGVLASLSFAGHVYAQQTVQSQAEQPETQRVEITGSAIKRIDAETAVPVTVVKMEDLKKQGITTVEQVMSQLSMVQTQQATSQVVGLSTGGASFADLRGIGANKTLVLLNGRRLANNAFDSSAPDLNMIPFAALDRVEVLRDGASALYGSDAVGGVINFITKKDFRGFTASFSFDAPEQSGGTSNNQNIGFGFGDLAKDGFNIFGLLDHQTQNRLSGTQRPFNTRYPGGLSPTTSSANYYQGGDAGNPSAPSCTTGTFLIPGATPTSCQMTTSSFVDYLPKSERTTALLKGTLNLNENHQLGLEYMATQNNVASQIAPVPYGGLFMNRTKPDGTPNPYYPGNPGSFTPNISLDPNYTEPDMAAGVNPGFIHVKWRDLPNGPRSDNNVNKQQRFVASLTGVVAGWDYDTAFTYNENRVAENLMGYSNGQMITAGVLNGVINPFGPQSPAGTALLNSAALNGNIMNAKGTTKVIDGRISRELTDWLSAGRPSALAIGASVSREEFIQTANYDYASLVVASTGIDPNTNNQGTRTSSALYAEYMLPVTKALDVTLSARYDKFSDFGNTTNPKVSFRYQPLQEVMIRGSYSTGFRAPSLYELNSAEAYTNTTQVNDPINCPGGVAIPGKPSSANCNQQFQALNGGNKNLKPETATNYTLGILLEPVKDLTLGVDLWSIQLKQMIGSLAAPDVFADAVTYASVYHRNSAGNLSTDGSQCPGASCGYVDLRTQNLGGLNTNGVDLSASYKWKTANLGSYTFAVNSTFVNKYDYQNTATGPWIKNVGVFSGSGAIFQWQHTANLNWTMDKFAAGLTGHYKSSYVDQDPTWNVPSYATFDTYASWAVGKNFTVTGGMRNMFDKAPPLSYQDITFQAGYDPRYADPLGRTYYIRGTVNF